MHTHQNLKSVSLFLITAFFAVLFSACGTKKETKADTEGERKQIAAMLDSFNVHAARADYDKYFSHFTDDAIFIGTDATENWNKKSFMEWAKPIFARGRAWNFTSLERNIFFDKTGELAWFDELLNTQMKICRGSGVVVKKDKEWKVQQYVLSTTIPNDLVDTIVKLKAPVEDTLIKKLQMKK